jgi:hypothetical protein
MEAAASRYDPHNRTIETASPTHSTTKVDFQIYLDFTLEMAVELGILDCDTSNDKGLLVTTWTMHVFPPDNHIALIITILLRWDETGESYSTASWQFNW